MQDRYDNEEFSLLQLFYSRLKYYKYIYINIVCVLYLFIYSVNFLCIFKFFIPA